MAASQPPDHPGYGKPSFAQRMAAQSRFLEGSMNDRVSKAPPISFLGPEEAAAYESHFYGEPAVLPSSAAATFASGKSGVRLSTQSSLSNASDTSRRSFFAPLWDGVRDRLSGLSRSRSASSMESGKEKEKDTRKTGDDNKPTGDKEDGAADLAVKNKARHSKESGSGNYEELVSSGFFETSPAKPRRASQEREAALNNLVGGNKENERPSREEIYANYERLVKSGFFSSHAIQSTRHAQPRTARHPPPQSVEGRSSVSSADSAEQQSRSPPIPSAPTWAPPPPPISGLNSSNSGARTSWGSHTSFAPLPTIYSRPDLNAAGTSPGRGKKRGHDDVAAAEPAEHESSARKVLKRLRKSTSRLNQKTSAATLRSSKHAQMQSQSQAEAQGRPSTASSSAGSAIRRSFSNTFRSEPAAPKAEDDRPRNSHAKLHKRRAPIRMIPTSPPMGLHHRSLSVGSRLPSFSQARPSSESGNSTSSAFAGSGGTGLAAPAVAFHYPSRTRTTRVTVEPRSHVPYTAASRAVPTAPSLPQAFQFGLGGEDAASMRY